MRQKLLIMSVIMSVLLTIVPTLERGGNLYAAPLDNSYIVVLHDDVLDVSAVAQEHALSYGASVQHVYRHALKGYAAVFPQAQEELAVILDLIRSDPRVAFISADTPVSAVAQTLATGVYRIEADLSSTQVGNGSGSVNVPVAVIDTGIQTNHPDLNVAGGKSCVSGSSSYNDGHGHGTHVAGISGARDNGNFVVGVAPGAPLYAVRVLNNQASGSWSTVICGIDWVTGRRAEFKDGAGDGDAGINIAVVNMSLGGPGADDSNCGNSNNDAGHKAICNSVAAGITYVVAAGNTGANSGIIPAAYNEVLTVTAMADFNGQPGGGAAATCLSDVDETAADFSSFTAIGSSDEGHTIAGPGVCILSTWKGSTTGMGSGTSMASPYVAGTAALCRAGPCAGMTPSQVMAKLRADAAAQPAYGFTDDPNSPNGNRYYGYLVYAGGY